MTGQIPRRDIRTRHNSRTLSNEIVRITVFLLFVANSLYVMRLVQLSYDDE